MSVALPPPGGSGTKLAFSSRGHAEGEAAGGASDGRLGVREDGGDGAAGGALHVHEV